MSDVVPPFQAFLIRQDENRKVSAAMESMTVDALDAGEVLIRVAYSSVNYKDALAATGAGAVTAAGAGAFGANDATAGAGVVMPAALN